MIAFTTLEIVFGSIILFCGAIVLFLFMIILSAIGPNQRLVRCLDTVLTWIFSSMLTPYTPNQWPPQAKLLPDQLPPTTSVDRPASPSAFPSPFWKQKPNVVDYSTDPDAKLLCIYVSPDAILNDKHISAHSLFTESAEESSNIKLLRSGTGFRVYNHPTIKDGQWLSCRR